MISFIVVDDEPLALENFIELCNWHEKNYTLLGSAANGAQAVELIKKQCPDVIFTDIRMPIMDGLELCQWVSQNQPQVRVVILSGYQDFEYARIAMSYGVRNYLLKDQITEQNILALLGRLSADIEKQAEQQLIERSRTYQKMLLSTALELPTDTGSSKTCCCILLRLIRSPVLQYLGMNKDDSFATEPGTVFKRTVRHEEFRLTQAMWIDHQTRAVLLESAARRTFTLESVRSAVYTFCGKMAESVHSAGNSRLFCVYNICPNSPSSVKTCLEQLKMVSACGYFFQEPAPFTYGQLSGAYRRTERNSAELHAAMDKLHARTLSGNGASVTRILQQLWDEVYLPLPDVGKYEYICRHLMEQLELLRAEAGLSDLRNCLPATQEEMEKLTQPKLLWQWFSQEFQKIVRLFTNVKGNCENKKIQQALECIHKNYAQNLTAKEVGASVGLSKVYFCNLFKAETGVNFGDYLTSYRMNVAKYLLANEEYKVYEVAEMTGYGSPQYFGQVFQKKVGMTPQAYKNCGGRTEGSELSWDGP